MPDFIKLVQVGFGNGLLIGIGHAFPPVRVQSVNQRPVVGDNEGFLVIPVVFMHIAKLNKTV